MARVKEEVKNWQSKYEQEASTHKITMDEKHKLMASEEEAKQALQGMSYNCRIPGILLFCQTLFDFIDNCCKGLDRFQNVLDFYCVCF